MLQPRGPVHPDQEEGRISPKGKGKDPIWLAQFKEAVELKQQMKSSYEQEKRRSMMRKVAKPTPVNPEKKAAFEPFFEGIRQKQQNTNCYVQ